MALTITEDWIRERVQLKHNNLEDVRSLSLPGTYHEKVGGLGNAMRNFTRLKQLDLSRNAMDNVAGLETLKMLEKLNLYYNNIPSLQELYQLRHNQKLEDLDLRLNPVARNEPDYRLFLIHMLPNLRRLDDRAVRDSERKAALQHFNTDRASELTEHPPKPVSQEKQPNSRAQHIKSLGKPATVVDDDDVAVLDLLAQTEGNLSQARPLTGSSAKEAHQQEYPPDKLRQMDRAYVKEEGSQEGITDYNQQILGPRGNTQTSHQMASQQHTLPSTAGVDFYSLPDSLQTKYPNIASIPSIVRTGPSPVNLTTTELEGTAPLNTQPRTWPAFFNQQQQARRQRVQFTADTKPGSEELLKFQDEIDAYTSYKAQGHFTPHPGVVPAPQVLPPASQERQPQMPGANAQYYQYGPVIPPPMGPSSAPHAPSSVSTQPDSVSELASLPSAELYDSEILAKGPQSDVVSVDSIPQVPHSMPPPAPGPLAAGKRYTSEPSLSLKQEVEEQPAVTGPYAESIIKVSDLVDKYWNGAKSLLRNARFKAQLTGLWQNQLQGASSSAGIVNTDQSGLQKELARLEQELSRAKLENIELQHKLMSGHHEADLADESKLKSSLVRAQRDVSILRSRLQKSIEENKALQNEIQEKSNTETSVNTSCDPKQLENIQHENEQLRKEIQTLNIRQKQYAQMQELAGMLQDSHKSLVETNAHLLKELEETRQRHEHEVQQLSWSYDQLKKTVGYMPTSSQPVNGSS